MLKIDLHTHSNYLQKYECSHSPEELINLAVALGFDALCISEHYCRYHKLKEYRQNPLKTYYDFKDYAAKKGLLLIPGTEMKFKEGEVLLINFKDDVRKYKNIEDLRKLPKDVLVIAPHPFFKRKICLGKKLLKYNNLIHGIEYSFYYNRIFNWNKKGAKFAARLSKPLIGNSDCHHLKQFAYTYSLVDAKNDPKSIVKAIKKGKVKVVSSPLPLSLFASLTFTASLQTLFLWLRMLFKVQPKTPKPSKRKLIKHKKIAIKKVKAKTLTKP